MHRRFLLIDDEPLMLRPLISIFIEMSFADIQATAPRMSRVSTAIGGVPVQMWTASDSALTVEVYEAHSRAQAEAVIAGVELDGCSCDLYLASDSPADGLALVRLAAQKNIRTLVVSSAEEAETIIACADAGADSYLLKKNSVEHIERGVSYFFGGGNVWPTSAIRSLTVESALSQVIEEHGDLLASLTAGGSTKSIAKEFGAHEAEVDRQLRKLYQSLGVKNSTDAVRKYVRHLMGSDEALMIKSMQEGGVTEDVAVALGVNPSTARSKLNRFYKKLGAANKNEAVSRLQSLGLLHT